MEIVEFFELNFSVVVRVHLHVLFSFLVHFIHHFLENRRECIFLQLPFEVIEHFFSLFELNLVSSLQELLHFFRLDFSTLICVDVLENSLAQGFQSVSIVTLADLNKVGGNLLIKISDRLNNA